MSAWIVDKENIDRAVTVYLTLREERFGGGVEPGLEKFEELCEAGNDPTALGQALWRMNYRAVNYRYDERKRCPKYEFEKATTGTSYHQLLKSLHCLGYQCSEGKVPNTTLFKNLEALEVWLQYRIATKCPEYEQAKWE